ncbi:MAG: hypothetical protein KAJ51_05085, partial [Thermoplasmata archaeon]|nr:hypothetical protein [Thermoplasmata archaeon]
MTRNFNPSILNVSNANLVTLIGYGDEARIVIRQSVSVTSYRILPRPSKTPSGFSTVTVWLRFRNKTLNPKYEILNKHEILNPKK